MAAPGKQPPKTMSTRLAGMKFMQRGSPSSPATPSEPPSKRQRLSNGLGTPTASPSDAIERAAAEKGDTKWYLSFKAPNTPAAQSPLRIVSAGYAALDAPSSRAVDVDAEDSDDSNDGRPQVTGRISYGNFKRAAPKPAKPDESESSSDSDSDDEDDEGDPTGVNALINQGRKEATQRAKAELKAKKEKDNYESQRLAHERRRKEVNLNDITSISNSGAGGGGGLANMVCHYCKGKGHKAADCPKSKSNRGISRLRKP